MRVKISECPRTERAHISITICILINSAKTVLSYSHMVSAIASGRDLISFKVVCKNLGLCVNALNELLAWCTCFVCVKRSGSTLFSVLRNYKFTWPLQVNILISRSYT